MATTAAGPLTGKVALVTGAARGIGLATAQALHDAGAEVWLVARSEQALAHAAQQLGPGAHAAPCDLTDDAQCAALLELVERSSGRLDLLVHSAGSIALGAVRDVPAQVLRQQLESNLVSAYALTRVALDALVRGQGDVVFIGSSAGRAPATAGKAQYAASHHGLRAFAEALREEVNPQGVRVAFLHVGQTATERQEALYAEAGRAYHPERLLQPADVAAVVLGAVLLPRTAEVTELSVRPRQKP
jgi:NAD(P)-dependent dehydrogenase (short-subunit alcohol dehydrogenase family)